MYGDQRPIPPQSPLDFHQLDQKSYSFLDLIGQPPQRFNGNLRDIVSVKDSLFGAKGDGVTDDSAAIVAASVYSLLVGGSVLFPRGTYLIKSTIALTSSHNNLRWIGFGDNVSVLKKGFNGTLITVTGCSGFHASDMHFYGDQNSWTGKGVVFSGASNYPKFPGCVFEGFNTAFLEFGADSGYDFTSVGGKCYLDRTNSQSAFSLIVQSADDTGANHRHFVDFGNDGDFDFSGSQATIITGSRFRNIISTNNTQVLNVSGCSWALGGSTTTINAQVASIVGNRFAGSITLGSGSSGSFIGNTPTVGTLTNNAASAGWTIIHHDGGAVYDYIGVHQIDMTDTVANTIQIARCSFVGDADTTYTVGGGSRIFYQTPLTSNRTVTLSTTNAKNGDTVRVSRQAAATGVSTLTVGSKALLLGQWVEYVYDSSAWQLSAFGTL